MSADQRLQLEITPDQREKVLKIISHWKAVVVDESTTGAHIILTAEKK